MGEEKNTNYRYECYRGWIDIKSINQWFFLENIRAVGFFHPVLVRELRWMLHLKPDDL